MVFSSAVFLFLFLPVVFLLYRIAPGIRTKNALLIVVSLFFYAFGEPVYVLLMVASVLANYLFGRLAARPKGARAAAVAAVVFNLALLGVFKYADFLIESLNVLPGVSIPAPGIRLPIGISFFTFQALSYVIDVYRNPALCQRSVARLMLYISLFPQLIAGPIVQYGDIADELGARRADAVEVAAGLRRFLFGLAKKLLVANTVGYAADELFAMNGGNIIAAWVGALLYCLQIYYDFSGYSDMAIGLGHMFGFHFKENFDYPYASGSIQEFWRRWHISLSTWFRDYLYIPLGGNRRGRARTVVNKYAVFFMTGLWHGASWNFVLWGLVHGTFLVLEDGPLRALRRHKVAGHVVTLFVVVAAFVLFRAETLPDAAAYYGNLFAGFDLGGEPMARFLALLNPWLVCMAVAGVVFALPVKARIQRALCARWAGWDAVGYVLAFGLFVLCVLNLASASFNPFIYFRF